MFDIEWVLVDTLNSTLELPPQAADKKQPVITAGCFR